MTELARSYVPRLETFTPAETEEITGVKVDTIRMWRKRGHVHQKTFEGTLHRFDSVQLGTLLVLKALSDVGIAPKSVSSWAGSMGSAVSNWATSEAWAWSDREHYENERDRREAVTRERFVAIFPSGGGIVFTNKPEALFNGTDSRTAGTVLDLKALGDRLRDRAGRPLMHHDGYISITDGDDN